MRVCHVTIDKTWSKRKSGVVDLRCRRFFIFYFSIIVASLSLSLDN